MGAFVIVVRSLHSYAHEISSYLHDYPFRLYELGYMKWLTLDFHACLGSYLMINPEFRI